MFGIYDLKTRFFENVHGIHTDDEIIIYNESAWSIRHLPTHLDATNTE